MFPIFPKSAELPRRVVLASAAGTISRPLWLLGLSLVGLHLLAPCRAAEEVVPEIWVSGQRPGKSADSVAWGVSGSKLPIVLDIVAPLGSSCSLDFALFQVSDGLAARLPGGGELIPDLSFADRTFRRVEVPVPMPEIERETMVLARVSVKSKSSAKLVAATNVSIRLVPGEESPLNPISRLKKLPEGSLLVTGESPRIRRFLDTMKIAYVDGIEIFPGVSPVALCEGNQVPPHIPFQVPVILFSEPDRLMPGVTVVSRPDSERIKVTWPVLPALTTDVLAQVTFADLIFSALPTQPKTEP